MAAMDNELTEEGGPPPKRIPKVCLRRTQAAGFRLTLNQGAIDLRGDSAPGPPSVASGTPSVASFSVTKVLPASDRGDVGTRSGELHYGDERGSAYLPCAERGVSAIRGVSAVRDSGLSNVFAAFEREFEKFQSEVQHSYMSQQGCADVRQLADEKAGAGLEQPLLPACHHTPDVAVPASGAASECKQCGKSPLVHGLASGEHGFFAATTNSPADDAAASAGGQGSSTLQRSPFRPPSATKHAACRADSVACAACARVSKSGRRSSTLHSHGRPANAEGEVASATRVGARDSSLAVDAHAQLLDTPDGSVASLYIVEPDDRSYGDKWLSVGATMSSTLPGSRDSKSRGVIAEEYLPFSERSTTGCAGLSPKTSKGLNQSSILESRQRAFVFDSSKFRKLKERAANVELELSDFCSVPEFDTAAVTRSTDSNIFDCKYTSHHECLRLVPSTCAARSAAEVNSRGSQASQPEPRTPRQIATISSNFTAAEACHQQDRDDADSGYGGSGGSGGSLPQPQGAGSARAARQAPVAASSGTTPALGREELCKLIRQYNLRCGSSQLLTMPVDEDASFQGCIQVCISLVRPISMLLSTRPASLYEALNRCPSGTGTGESTARPLVQRGATAQVSLPRNAVMSLHISSGDTAADVVQMLLAKFKITDNPKKFALYEQTLNGSAEVKLHKVADTDKPLVNFLMWNSPGSTQAKRFVLKEDNNGDVNWDAFSVPELLNFLRILEREEKDYVEDIRHKYAVRKRSLEAALRETRSAVNSQPSRRQP